mgnify:CR=1 FL=1
MKLQKIKQELTSAEFPEKNGISERMNLTLCKSAYTLLYHVGLSKIVWAEAITTAAYIRNRVSTSALNESVTPYEKWSKKNLDVSKFRVFGCIGYELYWVRRRNWTTGLSKYT